MEFAGKIKILIVEDNEDDAYFIRKALSDERFELKLITSGPEAFEYLNTTESKPDVVLLDNHLPGMSGIEILNNLGKKHADYGFIFLTIDGSINIVLKAMKAGALDFMVKSAKLRSELPEKIEKVFEIHRRKLEQIQLQANFNSVMNAGTDIIWAVDKNYNIIAFNNQFRKTTIELWQYEPILGSPIPNIQLFWPDGFWQQKYEKAFLGERQIFELRIERNNKIQFFEVDVNPIFLENEITGASLKSRDITERKKAEKDLATYAHELENIFNGAHDAMFLVDVYDNDVFRYRRTNRTHQELTGYSLDFIRQITPSELVGIEMGKKIESSYKKSISEKIPITYQEELALPGGKRIWETTLTPVFPPDENPYIVGSSRDITDKKNAEELENQVLLAKKSAAFKQNFLASISHEMRTPMNGIMGMTEFLLDTNLSDQQLDYASTIKESANSLLSIINDVLNLSKIEQGKTELKSEITDIITLFKNTENLFKAQAMSKKLILDFNIPPDFPRYLSIDQQKLKLVLFNLTSNALKYTKEGHVKVSLEQVEVGEDQITAKCTITDTGIGIDVKDKELVFEPFSRTDDSYTRSVEGTGLGLTITRKLVGLLQGQLDFESEQGKGSSFWFTFIGEIVPESQIPWQKKPIQSVKSKFNLNILVAEDKIVNQKVLALHLAHIGCQFKMVNDGQQLLDEFEPHVHDLILMDIMMPRIDGVEAMKQLRAKYPELPPIIALSAYNMENDARRFIEMGMDDYLEKPISKIKLIEILSKWS